MDDKNARFAYIMHKYGIVSGWRSAVGLYCKFNRCEV